MLDLLSESSHVRRGVAHQVSHHLGRLSHLADQEAAYSCALSLVTHDERLTAEQVRGWLSVHEEIVHSTIEIHRCGPV